MATRKELQARAEELLRQPGSWGRDLSPQDGIRESHGTCSPHIIQTIGSVGEWAGGPSRTVASLCTSVARLGYKVDLVAGYDSNRDGSLISPDTAFVRFHRVRAQRAFGMSTGSAFYASVTSLASEAKQIDIPVLIHDHGIWGATNVAAAKAASNAGVPYVLSPRGMLEPCALRYKAVRKKVAWALYQRRVVCSSVALVATSYQERDNIKNMLPHLPVAVIPNGVEWPAKIPDRSVRPNSGQAHLLFMSRVHPIKNLFGLVRAWQEVCQTPSRDHWVLQIAGPNELDHTREVRDLVHSLGLESRVKFLGPIDERSKGAVFAAADLFILPSFSENFGVVVAEALAHGLPVVATRGTPWPELVERRCGWWTDPAPRALAQALAEAVDLSAADRHAMGLRGRGYAQAAFSWDEIGLVTAHLYEWILGRTSSVPSFVYP
jgi:glycosyltransferase involved in cell wall biosynthesis